MRKLLLSLMVFSFLIACKQDKVIVSEDASTFAISTESWPRKSKVSAKSYLIIEKWPEYVDLDTTIDNLYTVENTEDLSLIIDDLIEKQKVLSESGYPEAFDKPEIKSRQKVFQTFVLKTKGDLDYRIDPEQSVKEMIDAFNGWQNQFDIIANNTLDIQKLLEE